MEPPQLAAWLRGCWVPGIRRGQCRAGAKIAEDGFVRSSVYSVHYRRPQTHNFHCMESHSAPPVLWRSRSLGSCAPRRAKPPAWQQQVPPVACGVGGGLAPLGGCSYGRLPESGCQS